MKVGDESLRSRLRVMEYRNELRFNRARFAGTDSPLTTLDHARLVGTSDFIGAGRLRPTLPNENPFPCQKLTCVRLTA